MDNAEYKTPIEASEWPPHRIIRLSRGTSGSNQSKFPYEFYTWRGTDSPDLLQLGERRVWSLALNGVPLVEGPCCDLGAVPFDLRAPLGGGANRYLWRPGDTLTYQCIGRWDLFLTMRRVQ